MVQPATLPFLAHFTALQDPRQAAKVLNRWVAAALILPHDIA